MSPSRIAFSSVSTRKPVVAASATSRSRLGFIRLGGARECRRDDQIPAREQLSTAASPLQVPGGGGPMRCHTGEILGWHEEPLLMTLEEPGRRSPEALLAIGLEELPQERQIEDSEPGRRLDELLQAPDA